MTTIDAGTFEERAWGTVPTVAGLKAAQAKATAGRIHLFQTSPREQRGDTLAAGIARDLAGGADYPDDLLDQAAAEISRRENHQLAFTTAQEVVTRLQDQLDTERRRCVETPLAYLRDQLGRLLDEAARAIAQAGPVTGDAEALRAPAEQRDAYLKMTDLHATYNNLRKAQEHVYRAEISIPDWRNLRHVAEIHDPTDKAGAWLELSVNERESKRPWPEVGTREFFVWAAGPGREHMWLPGVEELRAAFERRQSARRQREAVKVGGFSTLEQRVTHGDAPEPSYSRHHFGDPDASTGPIDLI